MQPITHQDRAYTPELYQDKSVMNGNFQPRYNGDIHCRLMYDTLEWHCELHDRWTITRSSWMKRNKLSEWSLPLTKWIRWEGGWLIFTYWYGWTELRCSGLVEPMTSCYWSSDLVARFIRRLICGKVIVGKHSITNQFCVDAPELRQDSTAGTGQFSTDIIAIVRFLIRSDSCKHIAGTSNIYLVIKWNDHSSSIFKNITYIWVSLEVWGECTFQ